MACALLILRDMKASVPMTRNVLVVPPELTLQSAWRVMQRERIRHLPVVRAGALLGMLSDRDILRHGHTTNDGHFHVSPDAIVADAMTPTPLETCEPSTPVSDLAQTMVDLKIDAIPVVMGLKLLGLVTSTDLLRLLIEHDEVRVLPFRFEIREAAAAVA
jgi:acetoin utilization protein AcuB